MWQPWKDAVAALGPRETHTVLVLGAGASFHLGYPLGLALTERIIENTRAERQDFRQLVEMGFAEDFVSEFGDELAKSVPHSIDDFLYHRHNFLDIGRACIAQELIKHEDEGLLRTRTDNWYACWLREWVCEVIERNTCAPTIVTFNYDRSLDKFLYDFVSAMYTERANTLGNLIPVSHVHGRLGDLDHEAGRGFSRPYSKLASPLEILRASKGIRVPVEIAISNKLGNEMAEAHKAIKRAKRVVFLGFGFDPSNLDRLRVEDPTGCDSWAGTNKFFGTAYHLSESRRQELQRESGGRLRLGGADTQILEYLLSEHVTLPTLATE